MDYSYIWNFEPGIAAVALRLACAMLVGLIIGTERQYTNRPAGMRTHILVALGACVVSITGVVLFDAYKKLGATPDPARLSAQVITGVGFLGAGTIMREGASVKGLTTAASLWAVACLGLACGFGYYVVALLGMVFIFITLTVLEYIQHKWMRSADSIQHYTLEASDVAKALECIDRAAQDQRARIEHIAMESTEKGYIISFQCEIGGARSRLRARKFIEALIKDPAVCSCKQTEKV